MHFTPSLWLSVNFGVTVKFDKTDLRELKIKLYSIGQASRFVLVTLITGTGIGLVVSFVASLFVAGLHFLTNQRNRMDGFLTFLEFAGGSLVPMIWLIGAALLLWCVRRLFDIERWHGPADSIFGAHRLDNEIDVKGGVGSTVGAFVSIAGGASVGQCRFDHPCHRHRVQR